MKPLNLLLGASLLANVALGFLLFQQRQQTSEALVSVDSLRTATNDLTGIAQLHIAQFEGEFERAKADQREAVKLRGDLGAMKKALATAESAKLAAERARAATSAQAKPAAPELEPVNPHVRVFNAKGMAVMLPKQAMLMGGWRTGSGKSTYAMVSPSIDPTNPNAVTVATRWVEMTDESVGKLGGAFPAFGEGAQAMLNQDQYAELIGKLEKTEGVDLLSTPIVTTSSGRKAAIEATQRRNTPDGQLADFGPSMVLTPVLDAATGAITVEVDATIKAPSEELQKIHQAEIDKQNAERRAANAGN